MPTITYNFDTSANFAFSTSVIEVTGGLTRLRDLTPTDSTFFASFDTTTANWGGGALTGALTSGAAISSGVLDLTPSSSAYMLYNATSNADSLKTGTIRMNVTPAYTGSPVSNSFLFGIAEGANTNANGITLHHATNGQFASTIFDTNGAVFTTTLFAAWGQSAGTSYEIEFNYDLSNGAQYLFVDGVQVGATGTGSITRSSNIGSIFVGSRQFETLSFSGTVSDFLVFSTVQHTAAYTSGQSISSTRYSVANPSIKPNSTVQADALNAVTETTSVSGSDTVEYQIEVTGTAKYHDGTGWTTATGGYPTETNTINEINTNAAALSLSDAIRPIFHLHSEDGSTRPSLSEFSMTYDFFGGTATAPSQTAVYGTLFDANGLVVASATVSATPLQAGTSSTIVLSQQSVSDATNSDGYWELSLFPQQYRFDFNVIGTRFAYVRTVPNTISVSFNDLT